MSPLLHYFYFHRTLSSPPSVTWRPHTLDQLETASHFLLYVPAARSEAEQRQEWGRQAGGPAESRGRPTDGVVRCRWRLAPPLLHNYRFPPKGYNPPKSSLQHPLWTTLGMKDVQLYIGGWTAPKLSVSSLREWPHRRLDPPKSQNCWSLFQSHMNAQEHHDQRMP